MTNSTSVTCPLLLAFLLLTPQASLARRYGWIGGAYWFRFWRNVDTPSSIALHKIDDGDMAILSETNETIEKKKAAMNPTLGPRYQYSQYDRLRVPIAVDVLFAHATGGYRPGPGKTCWMATAARDAYGLVAHPRTIREIAPASPVDRRLMEYHTTSASRRKEGPASVSRSGL
jgi:hypothetical protein